VRLSCRWEGKNAEVACEALRRRTGFTWFGIIPIIDSLISVFRFLTTVTGTFEPAVRCWHYSLFGLRPSCMFEIKLETLRFGDGGVQYAFAHMAHVGYLKTRDDPGPETYFTFRHHASYI
jgi:hypothetical protein